MKNAQRGGSWDVLSSGDLERIHQASLSLLEDPGIFSESDLILDLFKKGGGKEDMIQATRLAQALPHARVQAILQQPVPTLVSVEAEQAPDDVLTRVTTQDVVR